MFKELMRKRDINGAQLGRKLNISRSMVSRWALGKSQPKIEDIPQIADILGCTVEDIVNCFKKEK